MWMHLIVARAFVRNHVWMLVATTLSSAIVGLLCASAFVVLNEVEQDIRNSSESIILDVVLRDSADALSVDELFMSMRRRPDVRVVEMMAPEQVWRQFQFDIGVRSEGLSEIAAMPYVVRLGLEADFVTSQHVAELSSSVRRRFANVVEAVVLPQDAIESAEKRRYDFVTVRGAMMSVLGVLCVLLSVMLGRSLRSSRHDDLSEVLGRSVGWLRFGRLAASLVIVVFGGLLAMTAVALAAPALKTPYPWIDQKQMLTGSATAIGATITIILASHSLQALVPSRQHRA